MTASQSCKSARYARRHSTVHGRVRPATHQHGANFHGQKRKSDTHVSTSDPDSRLDRKAAGREAKLCYTATLPWRTGMGSRWLAWSRTPMAVPSAGLRRPC
jgi:hypothetical protein